MAYQITIAGVDRTTDVINSSIRIEDVINDRQNTCSFSLANLSLLGIPTTDQEIIITLASGTIIFGGYIVAVNLAKMPYGEVMANIECVDYARLLDRNLVHKSYEDMTDSEIINDIVTTYCAGFGITTTNVIEGVTIDQISFNYLQPSQCLRRICDLTGRNWYIDYSKDIHYFPMATNTTPFNITDTSNVQISEPMTSTPAGTLLGSPGATYDATNDWVVFTTATNNQWGALDYQKTLGSIFSAEMEFFAGGGNGADGNYFYWGNNAVVESEEHAAPGGYIVGFDEFEDRIHLVFAGVVLSQFTHTTLDGSRWRKMRVEVENTTIRVYVDDTLVINYTDIARTLAGNHVGVGARTGGVNNIHRCRYFVVADQYADYKNLKIVKDARQLKNRVYVRGGTKLSDATFYETKGDGAARKFLLPDKPHNVTVKVNSVVKTLGIKNIDTSGFDYYLNFQEKYVEQDSGATLLATTDTLRVEYQYDIPILVAVEDTASILANGQKEFAIFDKTITTTQAARDRASAELTDYANSLIEGSFITNTDGFVSGEYININLAAYGVSANYIVQKTVARSIGGGKYIYDISIASAKTMGIIRFLIELLEANKNLIELDDDEAIDELLTVSDSLLSDSLTDNLTIDSFGAYATWCTDSLQATPITRARWDLFQWG